jgi:inhibitor of cysteine peptidase
MDRRLALEKAMKIKHLHIWRGVWLGLCCLLLAGCGGNQASAVKITDADKGKTIELARNSVFEVALEGNPTTGYTWAFEADASPLVKQMGDPTFQSSANSANVVGAGGIQTFKFQTIATGQYTLKMIYHRTFEKGVAPVNTFTVNLLIKDIQTSGY